MSTAIFFSFSPKKRVSNFFTIYRQFHQRYTCAFFVRKRIFGAKISYKSALPSFEIFGTKISAKKACKKCWWNWHLLGLFQIDAPFWLLTLIFCPIETEKLMIFCSVTYQAFFGAKQYGFRVCFNMPYPYHADIYNENCI